MIIDLTGAQHHPALNEIVDVIASKTQNIDKGFFRAETAYFLAKMASAMRAEINTKDRGRVPVNLYVLALAGSGYGKGYSVSILENDLLGPFQNRFMDHTFSLVADHSLHKLSNVFAARTGNSTQEEYDKLVKEFNGAGTYPFTFDSGTPPAVKQLRSKLLMAGIGSINLQIDEIGSNLIGATDVLNLFLELFDQGRVKQKLVKNTAENQRAHDLAGKTPTNMLLFGTPTKLFDGSQTEDQFYSFLETGYARRCLFGFGSQHHRASEEKTPEEIYQALISPSNDAVVDKWAKHFHELADPAKFGWTMEVPDDVAIKLLEYKIACEKIADSLPEHQDIQKAELGHRYFKALKLAGAYAFIDESMTVDMGSLMSAILLIEECGQSFEKILSREKTYVKLAKYLATVGEEVTHADLHEALPFYKSGQAARNEQMTLATAWGYRQRILIKKTLIDGIEFFRGETLKETDLDKILVSYADNFAYNYMAERVPFDKLDLMTTASGIHWANHAFKDNHRAEEKVIPGFNMIVLDCDGTVTLDSAQELLKAYKYHIYTTKRHTEDENRFRIMLPINFELELDGPDYKEFMNSFMEWLPFKVDESSNQRAKKWESYASGQHFYNLDGEMIDALPFIPKTTKNEAFKRDNRELQSLDNLERWFAARMAAGNRNNEMIKFALALVDAGKSLAEVSQMVTDFNKKLKEPLDEQEIQSTIMQTVAKRYSAPHHN